MKQIYIDLASHSLLTELLQKQKISYISKLRKEIKQRMTHTVVNIQVITPFFALEDKNSLTAGGRILSS